LTSFAIRSLPVPSGVSGADIIRFPEKHDHLNAL
jgi:hypothetical protein